MWRNLSFGRYPGYFVDQCKHHVRRPPSKEISIQTIRIQDIPTLVNSYGLPDAK